MGPSSTIHSVLTFSRPQPPNILRDTCRVPSRAHRQALTRISQDKLGSRRNQCEGRRGNSQAPVAAAQGNLMAATSCMTARLGAKVSSRRSGVIGTGSEEADIQSLIER